MEQQHDEFWDHDGMRDPGRHAFRYALWPHVRPVDEVELTRVGYAYNEAAPALPFVVDGPVQVTAFKPAEDGAGWILRCHESAGAGGTVAVDFGRPVAVTPCDLLERPTGEVATGPTWSTRVGAFRIVTLRVTPA